MKSLGIYNSSSQSQLPAIVKLTNIYHLQHAELCFISKYGNHRCWMCPVRPAKITTTIRGLKAAKQLMIKY